MAVTINTTVITNSGESSAVTSGNMGAQIEITSFQIGTDLITPLATMNAVSGLVYTGTASQITYTANASTATMTFYITLSEAVGNFYVGNIGLFLADGTMFTLTALAVAEYKTATNVSTSPPTTGNARIYAIPIALTNVQNLINVTALFANYASLPSVATEAQLPAINAAPYNAYLVNTLSETNVSSIAVNNGIEWLQLYGILNTSDSAVVIPGLATFFFVEGTAISWNGTTLVPWDPSLSTSVYVGVVGQNDLVYRNGVFTITNGNPYTVGATYYAGAVANSGVLTTVAPLSADPFLQVGYGLTTNSLVLNAQCSEQLYTFHAAFLAAASLFNTINSVTTPYTILPTDYNKVIYASSGQVNLPIPTGIATGFQTLIVNTGPSASIVTINPNGAYVVLPRYGTRENTVFTLPNANGTANDFVWLEWNGAFWITNGGSAPILGAAYAKGSLTQSFSASEFLADQAGGYAFENSTGYYYMDATNAAVRTPVGGNFYAQNINGTAIQAILAPGTTAASAITLGQLTNSSLSPTFEYIYTNYAYQYNMPVCLGQMNTPIGGTNDINAGNTTVTVEVSFYVPGPGLLVAMGSKNLSSPSTQGNIGALYINGAMIADDNTILSQSHSGTQYTGGGGVVSAQYQGASSTQFTVWITLVWIPTV